MKWLGRVINALFVLFLSTLLVAFLTPWLDGIVPAGRLDAVIEFSQAEERPIQARKSDHSEEILRENPELAPVFESSFANKDHYNFAYLRIENDTAELAENVRVRFIDGSSYDARIESKNGLEYEELVGVDDIELPDMKPGDVIKVYVWPDGVFNPRIFNYGFKSYSSLGEFDIDLEVPDRPRYFERDSWISYFEGWTNIFLVSIAGALIILISLLAAIYYNYSKSLLQSYDHYAVEKERFEANPDKFEPKFRPKT